MVIANPPLAEPVIDPGGVTIKPPFEMGVANFDAVHIFPAHTLSAGLLTVPHCVQINWFRPFPACQVILLFLAPEQQNAHQCSVVKVQICFVQLYQLIQKFFL